MFGFLKSLFGMPKPTGPAQRIATIDSSAKLISDKASWEDGVLKVNGSSEETVRLVELPVADLEQCMLGLRFQISSANVETGVYPEIWVNVDGFGEAFSKGLNFRLKGSNDWSSCELPFYLKKGQRAKLVKLNVVFEGPGTVSLNHIELYSTPLAS